MFVILVKCKWVEFEIEETDLLTARITSKLWSNKQEYSTELFQVINGQKWPVNKGS